MMTAESKNESAQPEVQYYEGEPTQQRQVVMTCHGCKLTIATTISKDRIVKFCLCCGQQADIQEDPIYVKIPLLRTMQQ